MTTRGKVGLAMMTPMAAWLGWALSDLVFLLIRKTGLSPSAVMVPALFVVGAFLLCTDDGE